MNSIKIDISGNEILIDKMKMRKMLLLFNEVQSHEEAYKIVAKSNGNEIVEILDDVDYSDL